MSNIAQLKERVVEAEARAERLQSLVDAFFTGQSPEGGGFEGVLMAQWGRRRLAEKNENKNKVAALLKPE
jgi:hypothetical protein